MHQRTLSGKVDNQPVELLVTVQIVRAKGSPQFRSELEKSMVDLIERKIAGGNNGS